MIAWSTLGENQQPYGGMNVFKSREWRKRIGRRIVMAQLLLILFVTAALTDWSKEHVVFGSAQDELGVQLFGGISSVGEADQVTLLSADFEGSEREEIWQSGGGNQYHFSFSDTAGRHDSGAAVIGVTKGTPIGWPVYSQSIEGLPAGKPIVFNGWVRTEQVEGTVGAYIAIAYYDSSGSRISFDQSLGIRGTREWTQLKAIGVIPKGTVTVKVNYLLYGTGQAYFDDASVYVYSDAVMNSAAYSENVKLVVTEEQLNTNLLGFGMQLNPFTYIYDGLTAADKQLIEDRIKAINPAWLRVFTDTAWWTSSAGYNFNTPMMNALLENLQLCKEVGANINLVMHRPKDLRNSGLIAEHMSELLVWLQQQNIEIAALTLYNEPDLEYPGTMDQYVEMYTTMHQSLVNKGFAGVRLVVGDAAVFDGFTERAASSLQSETGMLSYHQYIPYKRTLTAPVLRAALMAERSMGTDLFLWETNVSGGTGSGTFSPGTDPTDGKLLTERYSSALKLSSYLLRALSVGVKGAAYWEAFDMKYSGNTSNIMRYGLWGHKTADFKLRPAYYAYQLMSNHIQPGSALRRITSIDTQIADIDANDSRNDEAALLSYMIDNPDGSRALFMINPWDQPVKVTADLSGDGYRPQMVERQLFDNDTVVSAVYREALTLGKEQFALQSGVYYDELPPESMMVITIEKTPDSPSTGSIGIPGVIQLSDDNGHDTGLHDGDYNLIMNMWWGNNGNVYRLYENGKLIETRIVTEQSPTAQSISTGIRGRANGVYTYYAELANAFGTTASSNHAVVVSDAKPGTPILSHNNWSDDADYAVTMNMWWGTNGTTYKLYENGQLIDTQLLQKTTPNAQSAVTYMKGKAPGTYTYQGELINAAGASFSTWITVQVAGGDD